MSIDRLQTQTNSQAHPGPLVARWFAEMVETWRAGLAGQHLDAFGVDDELEELGPSRHAVEREIGKAVWYG